MSLKYRSTSRLRNFVFAAAAALALPASASSTKVIHDFCAESDCRDGQSPLGLVLAPSGTLYGVTAQGGTQHAGTVFSLAPDGTYRVLHAFCSERKCRDSYMPSAAPIVDTAGNLYGVTLGRQLEDYGVIWRLAQDGTYSVLHRFGIVDGYQSEAALSYFGDASSQPYDGVSSLYGVTALGGLGQRGVMYELTPKPGTDQWRYRKIHEFCVTGCTDGAMPYASLLVRAPGKLVGVTSSGGAFNGGAVLSLEKRKGGWSANVLYSFCSRADCADGAQPVKGVIADAQGVLYGATEFGGRACDAERGCGVIYKITPVGEESVLHTFCARKDCADGRSPFYQLTLDGSSGLWGMTDYGGGNGGDPFGISGGTLFRFDGKLHTRYRFCRKPQCGDGAYPNGGLVPDGDGGFFATTSRGGAHGAGTVFRFTP